MNITYNLLSPAINECNRAAKQYNKVGQTAAL